MSDSNDSTSSDDNASLSLSDPNDSTNTDDGIPLSLTFLEFCTKVRNNDPYILLPEHGEPLRIRHLSEKEDTELADALLENTNVTYLELVTEKYTKSSAEAMAKYVRTSKHVEHIQWFGDADGDSVGDDRELQQAEEMFCCFLPAFQESTSLKELYMEFPCGGGPSSQALENMLTHTQSLRSLTLSCVGGRLENLALAAAQSGLKKNTTLRELTLDFSQGVTTISPILTSLLDHPLIRRLRLHGDVRDLTNLETVLLSDTSKITKFEIDRSGSRPMMDLTHVLQALRRHPALAELLLRCVCLGRDEARLLCMTLYSIPSLQSLVLSYNTLGSAGLAELAPALYHNTSIKVLDISGNGLDGMESAEIFRDIFRSNKTITILDLSWNKFGQTTGAVECIADGLGNNSALIKIVLSSCALGDGGVSNLAQSIGSRNTTLQKLILNSNSITSMGVGVLLETMEHSHPHITELELEQNSIGNEGAGLLARSLENNALPKLTRLSLYRCDVGADGFIALVSALEQNTSLLHLNLYYSYNYNISERAFLVLAESLPEIKVLQQIELNWCADLVSAMPLLLEGLRKNTSLFHFRVTGCAPYSVPPTTQEMALRGIYAGGWMQEMERVGYRNRFTALIRAPKERLPCRSFWPHALARVATLPDVIFQVLRSKPNLVPSEDTEGKGEAAKDTGVPKKRKRGNE